MNGVVDIAALVPFDGISAPSRDPACFAQVRVNPELGTITWPNDADIDAVVLHCKANGLPIPGE